MNGKLIRFQRLQGSLDGPKTIVIRVMTDTYSEFFLNFFPCCCFCFLPRLAYKTLFGGVEGFWSEHYRLINGFPNRFWGWGGEDDDLYVRFVARKACLQPVTVSGDLDRIQCRNLY